MLELLDAEDDPVHLDVVAVLELVRRDRDYCAPVGRVVTLGRLAAWNSAFVRRL
jgi:hypothetical protein